MPLQLTMPPATEPVTLQQAKTWLKVETDDEDTLIASLIPAAPSSPRAGPCGWIRRRPKSRSRCRRCGR